MQQPGSRSTRVDLADTRARVGNARCRRGDSTAPLAVCRRGRQRSAAVPAGSGCRVATSGCHGTRRRVGTEL